MVPVGLGFFRVSFTGFGFFFLTTTDPLSSSESYGVFIELVSDGIDFSEGSFSLLTVLFLDDSLTDSSLTLGSLILACLEIGSLFFKPLNGFSDY